MDILNSFLDILNSEYLWISINRFMDINKSFLMPLVVIVSSEYAFFNCFSIVFHVPNVPGQFS